MQICPWWLKRAERSRAGRLGEVRAGQDDERVVAAQFEMHPFEVF